MLPVRKHDDDFQRSPEPKKPQLKVHQGAGLDLFTCPRISGNLRLTKAGCSRQFVKAQKTNIESSPNLSYCQDCPVGELHSGIKAMPVLPTVCVHCEQGTTRKVGKIYCLSCYNRYGEFVKGKNARGATPIKFITPYIFEYADNLVVIGKDEGEAKRIVMAMLGSFKEKLLVNYGKATPQEFSQWWRDTIKPFSMKRTKRVSA